ncbi:hypothetical protein K445DRAFT_251257 [Daldinia sp. EC12]|nr:hypothetical protein K445DRAFT_251257 [Daldinia sp. EC12]
MYFQVSKVIACNLQVGEFQKFKSSCWHLFDSIRFSSLPRGILPRSPTSVSILLSSKIPTLVPHVLEKTIEICLVLVPVHGALFIDTRRLRKTSAIKPQTIKRYRMTLMTSGSEIILVLFYFLAHIPSLSS